MTTSDLTVDNLYRMDMYALDGRDQLGFPDISINPRTLQDYVKEGESMPNGYLYPSLAEIVAEYIKLGHRVSVFTLDSSISGPRVFRGERLTIHVGRYRPRARYRTLDFFKKERRELLESIKADSCDIIHAQ